MKMALSGVGTLANTFSTTNLFCVLLAATIFICCNVGSEAIDYDKLAGKELSEIFCSSCHLYTPPSLLPKASWQEVLPKMALRLGIATGEDPYKGKILEETFYIQEANIFPDEPSLSDSAWLRLVNYYLESAPNQIAVDPQMASLPNELFKTTLKPINIGGFPVVTMVEFNHDALFVGDLNAQLVRLDQDFQITQFTKFYAPIVDVTQFDDYLFVTEIGFLDDNDQKAGLIERTDLGTMSRRSTVVEGLVRPVHLESADLNQDGLDDLVISSFGHLIGDLAWYKNLGNHYEKVQLRSTAGTIRTHCQDADGDGDVDIYALFAHGDEGLSLFINEGGNFNEHVVLRFNPLWGTCHFQLIDLDGDTHQDLMIVNGDNSDFTYTPKSFHGVRLYQGMPDLQFTEVAFLPMLGATKAHAHDFDQDGDLDIFAHAFYPDFQHQDYESVLFFENDGKLNFQAQSFDLSSRGRWLVSDVGDLDQDGDMDIVVGSFALGPGNIPDTISSVWRRSTNHLLYLENKSNSRH